MSATQEPITPVIFRRERTGRKDVFAFFPYDPSDALGYCCVTYQHVGQHGSGDQYAMIAQSRLATPAEYAPLKAELERIGYRLRVLQRTPPGAARKRRQAALAMRK